MRSVLVVEDDAAVRSLVETILQDARIESETAATAEEALATLQACEIDVVLSDIRMPGRSGIDLVGEVHAVRPEIPIILMTAYASVDSAVEAMRAGAFDYITKPFKRDVLLLALERAFEHRALELENRRLRAAVDRTSSLGDLIGSSPVMREIYALIRKVANNTSNVLITGESGTGKDLVARTIHFSGARADQPFVGVSCTAIPEGLLESELFGHVRGAFTGAVSPKQGLFEAASGGTLFLDEIGDMAIGLQSKLLRVLQEREVRPVGGTESRPIDVRIISATHKDLRAEIEAGRFRRDLFYRLNVIPIHIPPLRERPLDIQDLAAFFLSKVPGGASKRLSPAALEALIRMPFEGNVRELQNVIERAVALAEGDELGPHDLVPTNPEPASEGANVDTLVGTMVRRGMRLRDLEARVIEETLRATGGNKVEAARILGISRRTLYRRHEHAGKAGARSGNRRAAPPPKTAPSS